MFGFFKKPPLTSSPEAQLIHLSETHIVRSARLFAEHVGQCEAHFQWKDSWRWLFCSATIPAFALVIKFETFRTRLIKPSDAQCNFFQNLENRLFESYRINAADGVATVRQCLPLAMERKRVCEELDTDEDSLVTIDTLIRCVFSQRLSVYQRDWGCGFAKPRNLGLSEYAVMRLAAELAGVATPDSLLDQTARELGIEGLAAPLLFLGEFASDYLKARNGLPSL